MRTAPPITVREELLNIRFMTSQQLCDELSITRPCLLNWRNQGMPYVPLGTRSLRYNLYDVLEWLEARKAASKAPRVA